MAGKTAYLENAFLKLLFNGTTDALWASAAGTMTQLYISLHTGDPTDTPATEQTTLETNYGGYSRKLLNRDATAAGWTVTGNVLTPGANIDFGQCSSGSASITYVGIGTVASPGTGKLLFVGQLSPAIAVAVGVIPRITSASTITES